MIRTYLAIGLSLPVLLAACGGDGSKPDAKSSNMQAEACVTADSTAMALAVLDYITTAVPFPQRFLHAVGTDSAVSESGLKVLQKKGPTFYYAGSDDAKAKLREKLEVDGPYTTMLVVVRTHDVSPDSTKEAMTLAGHYVANAFHGQEAEPRTYQFRCEAGKWTRTDNSPDPVD